MVEPIVYAQETGGALEPYIEREWLLTNGLGGFASGTVVGVNTRRYHGVLVAATTPPVGRVMTVSRFVEALTAGGRRYELAAGLFGGQLVGDGVAHLDRFELGDGVARWELSAGEIRVEKQVLVCWQENAAGVRYTVRREETDAEGRVVLHLAPLLALRDFHALRRREGQAEPAMAAVEDRAVVVESGNRLVRIESDAGRFEVAADWWYGQTYPEETARGMDDVEDHFTPGSFEVECGAGETVVTLWMHLGTEDGGFIWEEELDRQRQRGLGASASPSGGAVTPTRKLVRAADDFIVRRGRAGGASGTTVIAGYPWFGDWGRDTFISLPGLLLATGRHQEAGEVLAAFAEHLSEGMIPNRFNDYTNEAEYNTVDASLWFIHAAHAHLRASRDERFYQHALLPACRDIISAYTRGTRFGIRVDPADGLVAAGDETTQLTWMDARRDGKVFTPRHGKAVEINALWYSALMLLGDRRRAEQVRRSFRQAFVGIRPDSLFDFGLYDVVRPGSSDQSIRPNQIFAVSLPHSPLETEEQFVVVEVVRRRLLTPYGLRTLAPDDPAYQPRFAGPILQRDQAYHNGTVWPWLIGPFLEAWLKVNDRTPPAVEQARLWLGPLLAHLEQDGCLGSIAEVFDAEPPHRPGGCLAQAWSVAEVLRLAVELGI